MLMQSVNERARIAGEMLDNYTSAEISMFGMTCDSIGGLYLAYDLLGGEKGPLSKFTRIVTYSLLTFTVYLIGFSLKFALIGGISVGTAFAIQAQRMSDGLPLTDRFIAVVTGIRAAGVGLACGVVISPIAGLVACLATFVVSMAFTKHFVTQDMYLSDKRPRLNAKFLAFAFAMGAISTTLALIGESMSLNRHVLFPAVRIGGVLTTGIIVLTTLSPVIEWYADNVKPKTMGYMGAVLFMIGFVVQSIPSLCVLFE